MNVPTWLLAIGGLLTAIGGAGGIAALVLVRRQGRKLDADSKKLEADAAEVLTRAAAGMVAPLEDRLQTVESRLHSANGKLDVANDELDRVRDEAHLLRRLVQRWRQAILDPAATIEWLREMVGKEPTV